MNEDFINEALRALRRADAGIEAGPEAEIRALLAFRRYRRRRASQRIGIMLAAAAAVVALAILYRPVRETPHAGVPGKPVQTAAIPSSAIPEKIPVLEPVALKRSKEIATDFFPLMESQPPLERAMLVRVTVPAATMRAFGLPVGDQYLSDPVQADLLVGQDDLARAIRFVTVRQ